MCDFPVNVFGKQDDFDIPIYLRIQWVFKQQITLRNYNSIFSSEAGQTAPCFYSAANTKKKKEKKRLFLFTGNMAILEISTAFTLHNSMSSYIRISVSEITIRSSGALRTKQPKLRY